MAKSKKLHVVIVRNRDTCSVIHKSLHSNRKRAMTFLAAWCQLQWDQQDHNAPVTSVATDPEKIVESYFKFWDERVVMDILELELDPDPGEL